VLPVSPADIYGLTSTCLQHRYDEPKPVPRFHLDLWELCCSPHPLVSIAAPRGHAKSTAITFAYTLTTILFRQASHVLIISSNESIASEFVREIGVELRENEVLEGVFGPFKFVTENDTELVVQFKDKSRFRVIAKGAGQRMRGLKWERKRPDLVICDDMEDDEIVLNEDRREKFRRWFFGAVRPIVKTGGKIRVVGTIVHLDSLLERTMPKPGLATTVETPLKTYSTASKDWRAVKYRAHNEDFTEVLWPEQYSAERLKQVRQGFAEMGLMDVYGQEYLNDPVDQSTAYFRREDFLPMTAGDKERRKVYYVGGDFAISERKRAARTCFVVGGVDENRLLHVVDVRKGRWDTLQIIDELFALNARWKPDIIRLESENIEKTLRPVLESEMIKRQQFLPIDTKTPTKDKIQRARSFQFRMRAGNVRFDKDTSWYAEYEEELAHFPKWATLDQLDASAWLGDLISDELAAPTDTEIDNAEYADLVDSFPPEGVSQVTGY
jgi:predicted phage terminase large subunit-like protein